MTSAYPQMILLSSYLLSADWLSRRRVVVFARLDWSVRQLLVIFGVLDWSTIFGVLVLTPIYCPKNGEQSSASVSAFPYLVVSSFASEVLCLFINGEYTIIFSRIRQR
jgi:hypothetical protein